MKKQLEPLPSTQNNYYMERKIHRVVKALGYHGDLVFEHGHWWLILPDGSIFDVVDQIGGDAIEGFALERVS